VRTLGLVLYGLAVVPILLALFGAWFAVSWGAHPAGLIALYGFAGILSWTLWFTGRVLRHMPAEKPE
jgi:hypothetical protein